MTYPLKFSREPYLNEPPKPKAFTSPRKVLLILTWYYDFTNRTMTTDDDCCFNMNMRTWFKIQKLLCVRSSSCQKCALHSFHPVFWQFGPPTKEFWLTSSHDWRGLALYPGPWCCLWTRSQLFFLLTVSFQTGFIHVATVRYLFRISDRPCSKKVRPSHTDSYTLKC